MSKNIMVIGERSYVGSNICQKLNDIYNIFSTYNRKKSSIEVFKKYQVDLSAAEPFAGVKINHNIDVLIWCTQSNQYSQSLDSYDSICNVNIRGLQKTLDFCYKYNIKKMIFLSSGSVYQTNNIALDEFAPINYKSHYGFSKFIAEQMCRHYSIASGLKVNILRLFTVYGPEQKGKILPKLKEKIINSEELTLNGGVGMHFTPIFIDDLIDIINYFIEEVEDEFDIYNLASSEVVSLKEAIDLMGALLGKNVTINISETAPLYSVANNYKLLKKIGKFKFTLFEDGMRYFIGNNLKCAV